MTAPNTLHREDKNPVPVPVEEAIEMINNARRRMVVILLDECGGGLSVDQVAVAIAAMENDCQMCELTAQQRKRVYISLIQTHLQRLDNHGVILYQEQPKTVTPTNTTGPIAGIIRDLHRLCGP